MKTFSKIIMVFGIVMLMTSFRTFPLENSYTLTIKVDGLRNSEGVVQFALYNRDGAIPDENFKEYYKMATSDINGGSAAFTFFNLPLGKYAVNVLHDENENGKIDKGLILPKEGIGFSNYETINLMNRPKFSKASFQLSKNSTQRVKIIYL
ncbi:MAG: DUF2141 domain-containing protein [Aequorivita sp.]|nr:DUF2141 domain-containing protein [Aequorivita sp.]